jgi:HK97 family phage major capsid protein
MTHDVARLISEVNSSLSDFRSRNDSRISSLETAVDDLAGKISASMINGGVGATQDKRAREAFGEFVKTGSVDAMQKLNPQAAMSVGSNPDGGHVVPPELDRNILQLQRNLSPMRRLAQIVQTTASVYDRPVNLGGTTSGWVSETALRPETNTPQLGLLSFPSGEIYAMPAVTQKILDDAVVNIADFVSGEVAKEFDEKEGVAFISGDGVDKPKGFLAYPTASTKDGVRAFGTLQFVNSGSASGITTDSLVDLLFSLKAGYRARASWLMNSLTASVISKFKDSDGRYIWQQSLAAGIPSTLLGYPVEIDENMPDVAANAFPVAFGDWSSGYLIADRIGTRILRDPFSKKPYVLFYVTKRVGGGLLDSAAIKLLKVSAS